MHDENLSGSDAQRYSRCHGSSVQYVWPSWLQLKQTNSSCWFHRSGGKGEPIASHLGSSSKTGGFKTLKVNKQKLKDVEIETSTKPTCRLVDNGEHQGPSPVRWAASHRSGAFPARTSCQKCKMDLSLTYRWPMPANIYLNYHTSSSQSEGKTSNGKWQMVSCFINSPFRRVWLPAINLAAVPVPPLRGTGRLLGASLDTTAARCYKRHVRDFNLDSCAVDNHGSEACFGTEDW